MLVEALNAVDSEPALKNSLAFPKAHRLLKRREYRFMNYQAQRLVGRFLMIRVKRNRLHRTRLGVSASRKFGKAHIRNRFKRCIKEIFRTTYFQLEEGLDIAISPRSEAVNASYREMEREFLLSLNESARLPFKHESRV